MRTLFLWLASMWLLGIGVGVTHASYEMILLAVAGTVFCLVLLSRHPYPLLVGMGALVLLGALWGRYDVEGRHQPSSGDACTFENSVTGTVHDRPVYEGIQARFFLLTPTGCTYLVYGDGQEAIFRGDEVRAMGRFQATGDVKGDDTSFREYLVSQGASGVVRGEVAIQHAHRTWLQKARTYMVSRTYATFSEPEASLAAAMVFDERGGISDDIQDRFRATGTSHILAISGSNISLMAGILLLLGLLLPISPWWRTGCMLVVMWLYIFLIDRPVSAVRASVFWTAVLIAFRLSALMSLAAVIVVAILLMVSFRPTVLLDIGFQLSLAAVMGIGMALFLSNRLLLDRHRIGVIDLALSSVGAFVATWPIVMYHFGSVSLIGLAANLVVVPLMSLLYALMVLILLIDYVTHVGAHFISMWAHLLWVATDTVTRWFAMIPYGYWENIEMPLWVLIAYYICIGVSCAWIVHRQKRSWREVWQ